MGHLRDLPKSTMGVDIEHGFEPQYIPVKGKEDIIAELRKRAKDASMVYLATDPDREGEAIAWHLKELLELPDDKACRVTFNEITKKVVTESIRAPRDIDVDLVDAQQARRILDRIVGYELSPLLWKKIRRGLSAGRVQSGGDAHGRRPRAGDTRLRPRGVLAARRLAPPRRRQRVHRALLRQRAGRRSSSRARPRPTPSSPTAKTGPSPSTPSSAAKKQRSPSPPFITSTLQQEASRRLGMTPRRTMSIAQQLYEGVDITNQGTIGLITYMRTDSLRLSEEALAAATQLYHRPLRRGLLPRNPEPL